MDPGMKEVRRAIESFAKRRGIDSIQEYRPSRDELRRTFRLGESLVAKAFAADESERFEREHLFLEAGNGSERIPRLVMAQFDAGSGGYIVMTALKGQLAAEIQAGLSGDEYVSFARAVGECMADVHCTVALASFDSRPDDLVARRKSQFDAFPAAAARLRDEGILDGDAIPALADVMSRGRELAFSSARRPIHGDLHVWNILVDERQGKPWCAIIDFEESAHCHVELDFVHPFMSVLGEAFPGRRLAGAWERIWTGFVDGYASRTGEAPNLELTVGHVVAWCLWGAARCLEQGLPRYLDLTRSALDAAALLGNRRLVELASKTASSVAMNAPPPHHLPRP